MSLALRPSGVRWIGDIPADWKISRSKRLFAHRNQRATAQHEQMTASQQYGVIYQNDYERLTGMRVMQVIHNKEILKLVEAGDFVISMRSFQGGLEYSPYTGAVSSAYVALKPSQTIEPRFYKHLFKSELYIQALQATSNLVRDGQALRYSNFEQVDLPLPPVNQQRLIADFLDRETAKIDGLIEEQETLISLLQEKRQTVISHAVTKGLDPDAPMKPSGIDWLGDIPAHWDRTQVGRLCSDVADGPHFSPKYVDEGYMFISARNVRVDGWQFDDAKFISEGNFHEFCKRIRPRRGDVLYTKGGTTGVARAVDFDEPFQVWVHIAVLRVIQKKADPFYVAYALNSIQCYEQSQLHTRGATNQDLGLTRLIKIWLALPPLDEQRTIVAKLDKTLKNFDDLICDSGKAVELLKERRAALISAAVTGKIDVRGLAIQSEKQAEEVAA
ncbi:MAG: restriction endonuclease subunit S [Henriciella sp.]|uniref:restriction endonuclease subunit S n=1 Tax=Henriciella sp. TaxID=1968823 RepID=UPI0032ED12D4